MPTVTKDILYPGRFRLPTGEVWECPPGAVRSAVVNGNGMLARGNIAAPVIWEHDLDADPLPISVLLSQLGERDDGGRAWAGNYARQTFGYATRYHAETVKGTPVVFADLQIPDAADAKQFEKTRYVSARVNFNHTDTDGRHWPGWSVGHVAATPTPVQMRQMPVMLSQTARGGRRSWCSVYLSADFREGATVEGEKDGDKGGGKGGGKGGDLGELIAELANHGITIPDDVVTDVPSLVNALKVISANKGGAGDLDTDDDGDVDAADAGAVPAGGMGAMLSALPVSLRGGATALVDSGRKKVLAEIKSFEPFMVKNGHWTVPAVRDMEKIVREMDGVKLLSAIEHGGKVSRVMRELEIARRLKKREPLAKVNDPDNPGVVQLSQTVPGGAKPVAVPSLGGSEIPAEERKAQIEAARQMAWERLGPPKK